MKIKFFAGILAGLIILLCAGLSRAEEPVAKMMNKLLPFENLEMAGYFKNETALRLAGGVNHFMKEKNIVDLKANYRFTDRVSAQIGMNQFVEFHTGGAHTTGIILPAVEAGQVPGHGHGKTPLSGSRGSKQHQRMGGAVFTYQVEKPGFDLLLPYDILE